jgi:erythronate-4-phosphate dehydrogenase
MIIAVDKEIPYGKQAFSQLGEVRFFAGRNLKSRDLTDVDALIVRTITPVNASLLDDTPVRFLGAASAGTDHVDQEYLRSSGIHFHYAAGCNADSVTEYIVTVLHIVAAKRNWDLREKSIAVIGVGNVGSRVARKAQELGMQVSLCDPPLRELTGDARYRNLNDVLSADILTFHVPLVAEGPYPTQHMLNRKLLERLSNGQYVINTSRGPIFNGGDLQAALRTGRIAGAVLDVWEDEPLVDYSLLGLVDIGTPHIAGGALDGKIRATEMIREALSQFVKTQTTPLPDAIYPEGKVIRPVTGTAGQDAVRSVLVQAYAILDTDRRLRELGARTSEEAATGFERLRTEKPLRLEFRHFTVEMDSVQKSLAEKFQALGFQTRIV